MPSSDRPDNLKTQGQARSAYFNMPPISPPHGNAQELPGSLPPTTTSPTNPSPPSPPDPQIQPPQSPIHQQQSPTQQRPPQSPINQQQSPTQQQPPQSPIHQQPPAQQQYFQQQQQAQQLSQPIRQQQQQPQTQQQNQQPQSHQSTPSFILPPGTQLVPQPNGQFLVVGPQSPASPPPAPVFVQRVPVVATPPAAVTKPSMPPPYSISDTLRTLGRGPATVTCPYCEKQSLTNTLFVAGSETQLWSVIWFCLLCAPCIPYLTDDTKDVEHRCGSCGRLLAIARKAGGTEVMSRG